METFLSGGVPIRLHVTRPATPGPHPAIVLLHGSGGGVSFWLDRIAPMLSRLGVLVYAVHYFDRTGTDRATPAMLTDGSHVPLWLATVRDAVIHIRSQPGVDPRRIALVGVSLGAFLSLALGCAPNHGIRAIVDISGGLVPPYEAQANLSFPSTLIIHGDADTVVPVSLAHSLRARLTALHIPHEQLILPGEGHWFSAPAQLRILGAVASFLGHQLGPRIQPAVQP